jgi:hypothetical protein
MERHESTMAIASSSSSSSSSPLVIAANVYITAGGDPTRDRPILTALVKQAQEMIRASLNQPTVDDSSTITRTEFSKNDPLASACGVLVHAYTDQVYNRSSLHLAGSPQVIATVVPALVTSAIQKLQHTLTPVPLLLPLPPPPPPTPHPTVGLVDHVAVLPLGKDESDQAQLAASQRAASSVAHSIRSTLINGRPIPQYDSVVPAVVTSHNARCCSTLEVLPYGMVDGDVGTNYLALADVRRTRTRFFQTIANRQHPTAPSSSPLTNGDSFVTATDSHRQVILVGAPRYFVENYNVRLTAACPPTDAKRLCRLLRSSQSSRRRAGGLMPHVEALVLPYGGRRTEVACNLLRPTVTSSADIDAVVVAHVPPDLVERSYRVGTTAHQCLEALYEVSSSSSTFARSTYDQQVIQTWLDCWSSQE